MASDRKPQAGGLREKEGGTNCELWRHDLFACRPLLAIKCLCITFEILGNLTLVTNFCEQKFRRDGCVQKLVDGSRKIGELETRYFNRGLHATKSPFFGIKENASEEPIEKSPES
jgi:hypothetical protein